MSKTREISMAGPYFKVCESCKKRSLGCHSTCKEYAKEVIFGILYSAQIIKESDQKKDVEDYIAKRGYKREKKKRPENRYKRTALKRR